MMGFGNFLEKAFFSQKPARHEQDIEWDEKFKAALNFADYQDEQAIHRFTVAWREEIEETLQTMRNHWAQAKEYQPDFTVENFWDYWSANSEKMTPTGLNKNDPADKFLRSAFAVVDRMAWSILRLQLMREAGISVTFRK